jgi:hypothetical protein
MSTIQQPSNGAVDWHALFSSRLVIALGGLLVLQLLLALVLDLESVSLSPATSQGPLLSFKQADVIRIRIESPSKAPLILEKTPKGWQIPALADFPAADFRVTELLTKLGKLEKRLPVATSEAGAKRFKVADDGYERRLTLEGAKGPLATLYLGDSPGFRRLFVRADGEKAVYEAELALFDASDKADDWSDKNALHLKEKDVQRIELSGIVLARDDKGAWKLDGLAAGETLNKQAADDLVRKVADLNFLAVLGKQDKPEYKQQAPTLEYKVKLASDETLTYRISKPEKGEDYVLKASNSPYYFRVSKYTVDGLTEVKRAKLLDGEEKHTEREAPPPESAPPQATPSAERKAAAAAAGAPAEQAPPAAGPAGPVAPGEASTDGAETPPTTGPSGTPETATPGIQHRPDLPPQSQPQTQGTESPPSAGDDGPPRAGGAAPVRPATN